ncbi:hypothetical protein TUM4438_25330 [Shewanella sairae]|uniref:Uncharacterized protein n=1 Tax=Shewanella sairae TaxID=190310 RepID=A0ABQ4PI73_9GAMM|nr:hypothetical protein [Shewanella sairae]MCL1131367.1 hypothetical protein [Shewanella sairae]GIU47144.1 hypothetical protein TUM4438_25330 [Shewanella sairae]
MRNRDDLTQDDSWHENQTFDSNASSKDKRLKQRRRLQRNHHKRVATELPMNQYVNDYLD